MKINSIGINFQGLFENLVFYFIKYGGILSLIFTIVFAILYFKKKKKSYCIGLIVAIIVLILNIIIVICAIGNLKQFTNILENNAGNLII